MVEAVSLSQLCNAYECHDAIHHDRCAPSTLPAPRLLHVLQVCDGYRPPRPERLPDAVWSLVEECWHDDPVRRPPMDVVLQRLRELRDQEAAQPTDGGGAMGGCGCVVS